MKIKDLIATSPKWEHPDPTVRLKAVSQLPIDDEILLKLIADDGDQQVKSAAVTRLSSGDDLCRLMEGDNSMIASAARTRYQVILNATSDIDPYLKQIAALKDREILRLVAISANSLELKLASVQRIVDEDTLVEIAADANLSAVRQAAVQKISAQQALLTVLRDSLGKDKNVYRIAKEKLAEIQATEEDKQSLLQQCEQIVESISQHANSVFNPSFERAWRTLVDRWQRLEASFESIQEVQERDRLESLIGLFAAANRQCEEIIQQLNAQKIKSEQAEQSALSVCDLLDQKLLALAGDRSVLDTLEQFRTEVDDAWRKLQSAEISNAAKDRYFNTLSKIDSIAVANAKWLACTEELQHLLTDAKSAVQPEAATRKALRRILSKLHWPEITQPPAHLVTARQELERLDQLHAEHIERENQSKTELTIKLDQLEQAVESGALKRVDKLFKEAQHIEAKIASTPLQQERISTLSVKIRELRDWQGFATNPKREELCSKMEDLIIKELHPRDKADRIKTLQQEWKSLGASHSYKSQKLWHRFRQAADHAYEPCQAYFKEQENQRQQNLKERNVICTHLEAFLDQTDWDNVNWRGVADIIQAAKKEWRRFENINRSKRKIIQTRFYKVLDQLQAKLLTEQNINRDTKKNLIEEIKPLVDEAVDLNKAIIRTKELQQAWKQVGFTQLRVDQSLWKEFRSYCDQVFERRSKQNQAGKIQEQAFLKEADLLCRDIEIAASNRSEATEPISNSKLKQARSSFDSLNLPQRASTALRQRFTTACTAYEEALIEQEIAARQAVTVELKRRATLCCILESCPSASAADDAIQAWQNDAKQELPRELDKRITQRWEFAQTITATTATEVVELQQTNLKEAQLLCIKVEILAGIDSPAEALPLVMEYQVSRLNKGLSRRERETKSLQEQRKELQIDWYCLGPLPCECIADLSQRFESATTKI